MELADCAEDELARSFAPPSPGTQLSVEQAYLLAYQSALQGAGTVRLNPMVGVVLVDRRHRFLALGWHAYYGGPHAEVRVMEEITAQGLAGELAGATLYCTLEPCCYEGKTPACTDLLATLPISRVVIAQTDPNPRVSGQGVRLLQQAGIIVEVAPVFRRRVGDLLDAFSCNHRHQRPYVAAKIASSLDGYIGSRGAKRHWLTNERARAYTHWLRQRFDAIMVGADTLIHDNPLLAPTLFPSRGLKIPWKIVLDPRGRALDFKPLKELALVSSKTAVLWLLGPERGALLGPELQAAAKDLGVELVTCPLNPAGRFVINELLALLQARGIGSVLLEGGRFVWGSFAAAGVLDKLYLLQIPQLMGLREGMAWNEALHLSRPVVLHKVEMTLLDDNWLLAASLEQEREIL